MKFHAVVLLALPAGAFAEDVGYQIETSVASTYVARGVVQYQSRDTASSQSTGAIRIDDVADGSVIATLWSAVALDDFDGQPGTAVQVDASLAYTRTFDDVELIGGYLLSMYPKAADGTPIDGVHELFGGCKFANPTVSPFATANIEFVRQQGAYLAVGATRDFRAGGLTVSPMASVGFAAYRKYLGMDTAASPHANDVTTTIGVRYDLPSHLYIAGKVSYAAQLTPNEYAPAMDTWDFDGRSTLLGALAVGVAR
jgi:hypothetical protein